MRFFGVNFILQKLCQYKKNDNYQVCFCVQFKIKSNKLQQQQQQPCQPQSLPRPLGHQIYNKWWFPEKEWSLSGIDLVDPDKIFSCWAILFVIN